MKHYSEFTRDELDKMLDIPLAELIGKGLVQRVVNQLDRRDISTVGALLHTTRDELRKISNFGPKSIAMVYDALKQLGFYNK